MANAIPMLEGTAGAGGYLVPTQFVPGVSFERGIERLSAVAGMPGLQVRQVDGKQVKYTTYVGRPAVATTAEGADKPATGAELAEVTLDIVKASGVVMFTTELIEDANEDLLPTIDRDIRAAFAEWVDQNALGQNAAGAIVGSFNSELMETTLTQELGATSDALALAISGAMRKVEANGYNPSGIILPADGRAVLRDARGPGDNAATPLYSPGFVNAPDTLYGLPIRYSTNVRPFSTAAAAGVKKALVGDFSQAVLAVRHDVRRKVVTEATINVSGTDHRLAQQNKVGVIWETRVGFVAHDLNRAFCVVTDAS